MPICSSLTRQGVPCKNGQNCHLHCDDTVSCSICLNPARKTRGVKDLKCGHRFHKKCINDWLRTGSDTCPMCRKPIDESKFKVSIIIENTEERVTNTWPLPAFSVTALLNGLGMEDFQFGTSEIHMDIDTNEDMRTVLRDLGIRISNLDTLVLDTE